MPKETEPLRDALHVHAQTMYFPGSDYPVKAVTWSDLLSVLARFGGVAVITPEAIAVGAKALRSVHFDGNGCGTHGSNGCSICFGPNPMDSYEVAQVVLEAVAAAATGHPEPKEAGDA